MTIALSREREISIKFNLQYEKLYDKFRFFFFSGTIHSVKICPYHQKHSLFLSLHFIHMEEYKPSS